VYSKRLGIDLPQRRMPPSVGAELIGNPHEIDKSTAFSSDIPRAQVFAWEVIGACAERRGSSIPIPGRTASTVVSHRESVLDDGCLSRNATGWPSNTFLFTRARVFFTPNGRADDEIRRLYSHETRAVGIYGPEKPSRVGGRAAFKYRFGNGL
jgi:hypothetical protein